MDFNTTTNLVIGGWVLALAIVGALCVRAEAQVYKDRANKLEDDEQKD